MGIYKKETKNGTAFIVRYTVNKKTKTRIVGYERDGMTEYEAFRCRLNIISSEQLDIATNRIDNPEFSIPMLFREFMKFREPHLAKNTIDNYRAIYRQYISVAFALRDVRSVTTNELQKYTNKLLTKRRPATVEKIVSAIKKFYTHLQNNGIYKYNPAANITLPKYDNKKYFSMPKKEVKRFIDYINNLESDTYRTLYYMLLHGRRVNEVLTLKWKNIDLVGKIYHLEYEKTKTRKNQYYHLEEFQYQALKKLKTAAPEAEYVFENPRTGKPITYTSFYKIHKKTRVDLGLEDFVIHNIRHMVAFMIVNNGYSLEITAKILGHQSIQSTQRYAVLEMGKAKNAYNKTISSMMM